MAAIQIVKVSESILDYINMEMDYDNEVEQFRQVKIEEFKEELTKALNCGPATVEIKWIKK